MQKLKHKVKISKLLYVRGICPPPGCLLAGPIMAAVLCFCPLIPPCIRCLLLTFFVCIFVSRTLIYLCIASRTPNHILSVRPATNPLSVESRLLESRPRTVTHAPDADVHGELFKPPDLPQPKRRRGPSRQASVVGPASDLAARRGAAESAAQLSFSWALEVGLVAALPRFLALPSRSGGSSASLVSQAMRRRWSTRRPAPVLTGIPSAGSARPSLAR